MAANRLSGTTLLLLHCRALTGTDTLRPSPYHRLEAVVGDELARLLVLALAPGRRARVAA
jgi:hypothetical protein